MCQIGAAGYFPTSACQYKGIQEAYEAAIRLGIYELKTSQAAHKRCRIQ